MASFVGAIGIIFIAFKHPINYFTEGIKWHVVGAMMLIISSAAIVVSLLKVLNYSDAILAFIE